jgi:hypothetical protein
MHTILVDIGHHMIDGQQLGPEEFGFTDLLTNIWKPKKYTGTFQVAEGIPTVSNGGLVIKADGSSINGNFGVSGGVKTWTSPDGVTWTRNGSGRTSAAAKYLAVGGAGTALRTFYPDAGSGGFTFYIYNGGGEFDGSSTPFTLDLSSQTYLPSQTTSVGKNGFYLPMDGNSPIGHDKSKSKPINDGTVWSNLTSGGAVNASYPMTQAFDGSTSTTAVRAVSGGGFVFGGSLGITYKSSVRIHSGTSGVGTQQFKLNDGTATDMAEDTFVTVATGSGTLNKLEITAGSTGNANIYLGAVEIDGVILVDNAYGNSFTPVNFGGSVALDSPAVSGGKPFLNVTQGGTQAGVGVFGSKENKVYTVTYADDGGGNKYYIDGVKQPTLNGLIRGSTYTFDTVALGSTHPFRLSATSAHGTEYTDGVDATTGTATTITIPHDAPDSLYYYCTAHSGMGSSITSITTDETKADPYASSCVLAYSMSGGRYQDDSSLLNCTTTYKASSGGGDIATGLSTDSHFYHTSLNFDGTGDNFTTPANSQFDFGTGAYTLEFWIKTTTDAGWLYYDAGSSNQGLRVCIGNNGGNSSNAGKIEFNEQVGNNDVYTQGTSRVDDGKWHHVAICRGDSGAATKLFVNGVHEATGKPNRNFDNNNTVYIGARSDGSGTNFNGNMQDFRMYKGIAKYTSNFVIPSPSPDILPDTPSGATGSKLTKITDGAVIFDGTGDKLSVDDATNDDFHLGTNDFTIEYFMYKNSDMGGTRHHVGQYGTTNANRSFVFKSGRMPYHFLGFYWYNGSNEYNFIWNEGPMRTQEGWKHVCVQRKSGKLYLYIDGKMWKEDESSNAALSINNSTAPLTIGSDSNTGSELAFDGSISNFRFINGTAIYRTGGFAPPTAPLTTTSQGATESEVKLLCCQSPTSAVEAAVKPADVPWLPTGYTYWTAGMSQNWAGSGGTTSNTNDYINVALPTSGKYYWETTINSLGIYRVMGISTGAAAVGTNYTDNIFGIYYNGNPPIFLTRNASGTDKAASGASHGGSVGGSNWANGDKIMWAWDATNDKIYMGLNGTWFNSGDPVAGTGMIITGEDLSASSYYFKLGYTADGGTPTLTTVTSGNSGSSSSLSKEGGAEATTFNPFNTDINTVRGQESGYATLNPLVGDATLSNNNLDYTTTAKTATSTIGVTSGKYYAEVNCNDGGGAWIGIINNPNERLDSVDTNTIAVIDGDGDSYDPSSTQSYTNYSGFLEGDVIGVALDATNKTVDFYQNGVKVKGYTAFTVDGPYFFAIDRGASVTQVFSWNFGQKPFKFPPPDGFQPLNTANTRPVNVISRPDQYVGVLLYTGNASTKSVSGLNFNSNPDFVWIKQRSSPTQNHFLYDTVRGVGNSLRSSTEAQQQGTHTGTNGDLRTFDFNGFSLGDGTASGAGAVNEDGKNIVAWCWKAGGNKGTFNVDDVSYASATAAGLPTQSGSGGGISVSACSVGTKQGFSIIKYGGGGNGENGIPHGLGRVPKFYIVKNTTSGSSKWTIYHASMGNTKGIHFDTDAANTNDWFDDKTPTEDLFYVKQGSLYVHNGSDSYISYLWADVPGLQKFGSFESTGNTDGPFIELGFRPALIFCKSMDSNARNWMVFDSTRSIDNPDKKYLTWEGNGAEGSYNACDFLSNGFKVRATNVQELGIPNETIIYGAWAAAPSIDLYGGGANAR